MQLRRAEIDDEAFLRVLYDDRRRAELAGFAWSEEEVLAFVDLQYRAQQVGYAAAYPDAVDWIVCADELPVGRVLIDRHVSEWHIVDLAVLTSHRHRGVGTWVVRSVIDEATAAGAPTRLTADHGLVPWYQSLGLRVVEQDEVSATMTGGG